MKYKRKILLILFLMTSCVFGLGITYSIFTSNTDVITADQKIAKFIFETEKTDSIELPLYDLTPGTRNIYSFAVSNSNESLRSDVTVNYQIIISTFHLIPLEIELYKIDDGENLIMKCDESYNRDDRKQLVCNSPVEELGHSLEGLDNYEIRITFPEKYSSEEYSNLVDYINLEIKSWQKINKLVNDEEE